MLVSWNWLTELVDLQINANDFAEKLTMAGAEVENLSYTAQKLDGIIIAKVLEMTPHRERKNLQVVTLVWGDERAICVTGAQNVKEGDIVPYAPPGATIADGSVLGIEEFDGVKSFGMMLSADEIGLPLLSQEEGILILSQDAPLGGDAASWLGIKDVVLDVSVTPNRGDLLSMVGMAREAHALFTGSRLKELNFSSTTEPFDWPVSFEGVTLEDSGCPLYCLGFAEELEIAPSPIKCRVRLALCGVRPISNVVDVTNYVMLLLGQPLHAFDLDKLPAPEITVRSSRNGEKIATLDGREHILSSDDLLITSGGLPIGLAGVMGGANSEIDENTRRILIESAHFLPARISTTARRLGINSEAAYRYARGVDKAKAPLALSCALDLMKKWKCGKVYTSVIREGDAAPVEKFVPLTAKKLKTYTGAGDLSEASSILTPLGFEVKSCSEEKAIYKVPGYRMDVEIEEDLIEEVARIKGYDELPARLPGRIHDSAIIGLESRTERKIRETLMARGYIEILNYSFISPKFIADLSIPASDSRANPFALANPLSMDQSLLRTFLLPGMVNVICDNLRKGWRFPVRIFEIGNVFLREGANLIEEKHIAGAIFLGKDDRSPYKDAVRDDFFTMKGDILALADAFRLKFDVLPGSEPFGHAGQTADVISDGRKIGFMAKIKPSIERRLELPASLYVFEVTFEPFLMAKPPRFGEVHRFPSVYRDISLIVPEDVTVKEIGELIGDLSSDLVTSIRLFDIYKGKNIPEGHRSLSFTLEYRHPDKTLSDEEVDELHTKLRAQIESRGLKLR